MIPAKAAEKPHLSALEMTNHLSPVIACDQALLEVTFMRDSDLEMFGHVRQVLTGEADEHTQEHVAHREDVLDNVQREVTEFLGKVMIKRVLVELDILNAYERVRAYYLNIAETLFGGKR